MHNHVSPTTFKLTIKMLSDWHIGIGEGRHKSIDSLIDRDEYGLPFIPAKTIRGIWRDAAERLVYGLSNGGKNQAWSSLVNNIFGSQPQEEKNPEQVPMPSQLFVGSALLTAPLRNKLKINEIDTQLLKNALTFIKPGVEIDHKSGQAKDKHLRFEEISRSGIILEAHATIHFPEHLNAETVKAFLIASVKLIERMGGKRRRGHGKCEVKIEDDNMSLAQAIEHLRSAETALNEKSQTEELQENIIYSNSASEIDWIQIPLSITTQFPLLIPKDILGNIVTTDDYIPGTYLLPFITKALANSGLTLEGVRTGISSGDIRIKNAYPDNLLPIPLCWESNKRDGDNYPINVDNILIYPDDEDAKKTPEVVEKNVQKKSVRQGYVIFEDNKKNRIKHIKSIPKKMQTHNIVKDDLQRPSEDVGGVYSYESLPTGTKFSTMLLIRKDLYPQLDETKLHENLNINGTTHQLQIGRAKTSGYGSVTVTVNEEPIENIPKGKDQEDFLYVYFASDVILRSKLLGASTGLEALKQALEKTVGKAFLPNTGVDKAAIRTKRIESWNASWNLPRPSFTAIQAGSCLKLRLDENADVDNIRKILEREGIGERKAEGYGQIIVNPKFLMEENCKLIKYETGDPEAENDEKLDIKNDILVFAKHLEKIAWTNLICERSEQIANNQGKREEILKWNSKSRPASPSMSQLGTLRTILSQARDINEVGIWLEKLKCKNKDNEKQNTDWPKGSIKILKDLFQKEPTQNLWELLELDDKNAPALLITKYEIIRNGLYFEALKIFFFANIKAHKRDSEKSPDDKKNRRAA